MAEMAAELPEYVYLCAVTWRRRKGKPVEMVALLSGSPLVAMMRCAEVARELRVPLSWVDWTTYRRASLEGGESREQMESGQEG